MKVNIRTNRKKRNLSIVNLEKLTGISKSSLSRFEREEQYPSILELEWIAIALDVRITDLFDSIVK